MKADQLHPEARKGIEYFNQGEFYKAHDPLELAWMKTRPPERDLYQGILLIGLAYYQISRGNYRGAIKMFNKGQDRLRPLGNSLFGINLTRFLTDAKIVEDAILSLGPDHLHDLDQLLIKPVPLI